MKQENLYIITGATGFLSNNLIRLMNEKGIMDDQIRGLALENEDLRPIDGLSVQVYRGDVTKRETLEGIFNADGIRGQYSSVYVIHCAGIIEIRSKPNPHVWEVNVNGTKNVLAAARMLADKTDALRFIYISSVHAIPEKPDHEQMSEVDRYDPDLVVGQYAKSKAAASQLVLDAAQKDLDALILQPSGILGPYNFSPENMKQLIIEVSQGKLRAVIPGGYDFVDVRDVALGVLAACEKGLRGQSYVLSNHYIEILEICNEVCTLSGEKPIRVELPVWLAKLGAPLCELYYNMRHQIPLFTPYAIHTAEANANFSHEKASRELGYKTRSLQQTIRDMYEWLVNQPNSGKIVPSAGN